MFLQSHFNCYVSDLNIVEISHYFGAFQRTKRRIPLNKGFQLLAHLKTLQFPYLIAEVGPTSSVLFHLMH